MSLPHHRRYRLLAGTKHDPIRRTTKRLVAAVVICASIAAIVSYVSMRQGRDAATKYADAMAEENHSDWNKAWRIIQINRKFICVK